VDASAGVKVAVGSGVSVGGASVGGALIVAVASDVKVALGSGVAGGVNLLQTAGSIPRITNTLSA
jgi:hypothetical protein